MAPRLLTALAVGAALIAACDVSQKTPQTGFFTAVRNSAAAGETIPAAREVHMRAIGPAGAVVTGDESIRLQGPGVSRKRQIRV